jgi:sulfonate transport system ATP-binding protein
VREPKLLLLDEPFAALDALTRLKTQSLVASLWRTHRPAVLLVTHDVDEALLLADRVMVLDEGRIGFDLHVNLERPRRHSHPAFSSLRSRLLRELGVEEETADVPLDELAVGWNASARTKAPAGSGPKPDDTAWAASANVLARS